jgi:hypothetical protein
MEAGDASVAVPLLRSRSGELGFAAHCEMIPRPLSRSRKLHGRLELATSQTVPEEEEAVEPRNVPRHRPCLAYRMDRLSADAYLFDSDWLRTESSQTTEGELGLSLARTIRTSGVVLENSS